MLLSFLSKTLATLLTAVLSTAIITTIMNQTLLSSAYLEGQMTSVHGYDRASVALSDEIAHSPDLAAYPMAEPVLQSVLTPTVLKQKINGALEQMQAYYQGNGPRPVIDLTDLASQAQAAGVPVPQNSGLTQPIVLGSSNSNTKNVGRNVSDIRPATLILSVLLATALAAVAWRRRQFKPLPNVLISVGILVGLVALVLHLGSGLADHFLRFGTSSNLFASLGHDLADSIANDLAKRFGVVAVVLLAVGVPARIWVGHIQKSMAPRLAQSAPSVRTIS